MIDYLGSLSLGVILPQPVIAIDAAFTDLNARIEALLAFNPQPVSFAAQLTLLTQMTVNIQAMITLGIPEPSIAIQIAITLALVEALRVQLTIIADIRNAFDVAGVFLYAYDGQAGNFGPEFTTELAGGFPGGNPLDHANALVLATVTPAAWDAIRFLFKTTP